MTGGSGAGGACPPLGGTAAGSHRSIYRYSDIGRVPARDLRQSPDCRSYFLRWFVLPTSDCFRSYFRLVCNPRVQALCGGGGLSGLSITRRGSRLASNFDLKRKTQGLGFCSRLISLVLARFYPRLAVVSAFFGVGCPFRSPHHQNRSHGLLCRTRICRIFRLQGFNFHPKI